MNIKSLLLGSAAALVASGAYAADAVEVIAEPEPLEYVRVCDVAGTGYFYIPGTETCLRIGGYVRYDIGVGDLGNSDVRDHSDGGVDDTYYKRARLSLRTYTYSDTEYGALTTYTETRFQFTDGGPSSGTSLNFAWIQLGGFRVGKDESVFTTFPGYAGGVINDDIVPNGPYDTNLLSYYFDAGNGFSAVVSLEEGNNDSFGHSYEVDSYLPHVVGGVKYTQGWGSVTGVVGYDSVHEQFAAKARVDINVSDNASLFFMAGWGEDDVTNESVLRDTDNNPLTPRVLVDISGRHNFYKPWGGNWAVFGGGSFGLSEKATANVQLSYDEDENFAAVANVAYTIVPGLTITPEVAYWDNFDRDDADNIGGFLRFQRSF